MQKDLSIDSVILKIKEIILKILPDSTSDKKDSILEPHHLNDDDELLNDIEFDSLDVVEVFLSIEEEYGLRISIEEQQDLTTIRSIASVRP